MTELFLAVHTRMNSLTTLNYIHFYSIVKRFECIQFTIARSQFACANNRRYGRTSVESDVDPTFGVYHVYLVC